MLKKFNTYRNREDGFTLIELLVVVLIIGILAAIAVPIYLNIQNGSKEKSLQSDVATTRLSVAAALTQEKDVHSGSDSSIVGVKLSNSDLNSDEVVYVDVAPDGQSFTVTAQSAKQNYAYKYDTSTQQGGKVAVDSGLGSGSTGGTGGTGGDGSSVPAGTVAYQSDFSNSSVDGWASGDNSGVYANSVGLQILPQNAYANVASNSTRDVTGLVVGHSYTITAVLRNNYARTTANGVIGVDGIGASAEQPINGYNDTPVTYTFAATATTATVRVGSGLTPSVYERDTAVVSVKIVAN